MAVGHLVELAEPEDYDEKWKSGGWPTCRSSPDEFRLRPRDAKSKKQLGVIHKLLTRDDVDRVINACDAGREGELIFAYIYETCRQSKKPVERLWISSMTKQAIREGFEQPAPGPARSQPLEQAARSRSRGRLARRHERDARRDDPRPRLGRRRRLARPRPDADARA